MVEYLKLMKNYLSTYYELRNKPLTSYQEHFADYNISRFGLNDKKLLEVGCGRGDIINKFAEKKIKCYATDILIDSAKHLKKEVKFTQNNIEKEKLPYEDNFFDAIYTKSLLEHIGNNDLFFKECKRVLKKEGKLIIYIPDWETQYLNFYDDITHIKPFTEQTLDSCFKLYDFKNYKIEKFYQLPSVWKYPFLKYFNKILAFFIPVRCKIKYLRFSKELMLLGVAIND